ncbi:MAG: FAD-dependent monooxygenase [Herminiimonas sp.]|nr:FAD-dependent monooxygenase [Herminiimonas sp.]
MQTPTTVDIAICGAGPVGLALSALLVKRGMAPDRIALLDARPLELALTDPRSIALSYGTGQILQDIGAWPIVASTITQIHVSRRAHFGRTLIDCRDYDLPALGYVTRYGVLIDALSAASAAAGIKALRPATVEAIDETDERVELRLAGGNAISADIVVQAEGGVFGQQPVKSQSRDYRQTAIVAQVGASAPLPQRAFERFTSEGPLALLPQTGQATDGAVTQYALVWCMRPESASMLMAASDAAFLAALQAAFGTRVGQFLRLSPRSTYPLGLNADSVATSRTVTIGNAAQTLHPVAGQGLNLGMRDATVLAGLLVQAAAPAMLQRFLKARQTDRSMTIRLTDVMARIFASAPDGAVSQALLGLSLGAVDALPPARRVLAGQMMYGYR